ncbi:MAG: indolepyruvate oxidoreductase [Bdellovibrionales bacterium GWB1_55_8]|nr:MAG: indolepyruvate oxidoreductase [Bdellovibrionales bacterium GWB1_55_8]
MKYDIVFAGVGGQGILSVAATIASAAISENLHVKQSEVHGMSQRGGAVTGTLRISDSEIHSPLVPLGTADLILSIEPLESLRYLEYLSPEGQLVTAIAPVQNIGTNYPLMEEVLTEIRRLPNSRQIDAERLAREAGSTRAANMVLVGASAAVLPLQPESLRNAVRKLFERKGSSIVEMNLKAFEAGRAAYAE